MIDYTNLTEYEQIELLEKRIWRNSKGDDFYIPDIHYTYLKNIILAIRRGSIKFSNNSIKNSFLLFLEHELYSR
jgi:hypothetical protein